MPEGSHWNKQEKLINSHFFSKNSKRIIMSANQDIFTSRGPTNQQQHSTPASSEGARTPPSAITQCKKPRKMSAEKKSLKKNKHDIFQTKHN